MKKIRFNKIILLGLLILNLYSVNIFAQNHNKAKHKTLIRNFINVMNRKEYDPLWEDYNRFFDSHNETEIYLQIKKCLNLGIIKDSCYVRVIQNSKKPGSHISLTIKTIKDCFFVTDTCSVLNIESIHYLTTYGLSYFYEVTLYLSKNLSGKEKYVFILNYLSDKDYGMMNILDKNGNSIIVPSEKDKKYREILINYFK